MFTGLIEEIGTIDAIKERGESVRIAITASFANELVKGESVAASGVCLTVTDIEPTRYWVDVMPETLKVSALGDKKVGDGVNLERSLALGDRLGGHIVQGHVDAVGTIATYDEGDSWTDVTIEIPSSISGFIAMKGSVAIDGISLTVTGVGDDYFSVSLIPETLRATTLGQARPGQRVNIETDMVARYVQRLAQRGLLAADPADPAPADPADQPHPAPHKTQESQN